MNNKGFTLIELIAFIVFATAVIIYIITIIEVMK